MPNVRKAIYAMSLAVVLAILICMWADVHPQRQPECYTSMHPAATMPPLMGFAADSIVNTGDEKALDALPGVGEVISERMIEMREVIGGYQLPEDLLLVKGIGEKTLEGIMEALPETLVELSEMAE